MSKQIDFLYDFSSPNAYLAYKVLPVIAAQHNATINMQPVLLGGIFQAVQNQSPIYTFADLPQKLGYMRTEIARFAERHAVPFVMNTHFPLHPVAMMRSAIYAEGKDWQDRLTEALFDATWALGKNTGDPAVLELILEEAELPARDILNATLEFEIKTTLKTRTDQAVERGAFGAPTFFIDDAMFFGKDSLVSIDDYLAGRITQ